MYHTCTLPCLRPSRPLITVVSLIPFIQTSNYLLAVPLWLTRHWVSLLWVPLLSRLYCLPLSRWGLDCPLSNFGVGWGGWLQEGCYGRGWGEEDILSWSSGGKGLVKLWLNNSEGNAVIGGGGSRGYNQSGVRLPAWYYIVCLIWPCHQPLWQSHPVDRQIVALLSQTTALTTTQGGLFSGFPSSVSSLP